jgi:hypothetical protein
MQFIYKKNPEAMLRDFLFLGYGINSNMSSPDLNLSISIRFVFCLRLVLSPNNVYMLDGAALNNKIFVMSGVSI